MLTSISRSRCEKRERERERERENVMQHSTQGAQWNISLSLSLSRSLLLSHLLLAYIEFAENYNFVSQRCFKIRCYNVEHKSKLFLGSKWYIFIFIKIHELMPSVSRIRNTGIRIKEAIKSAGISVLWPFCVTSRARYPEAAYGEHGPTKVER